MDECGIDTYLYREYGYAPRGQRVFGVTGGKKYKRLGIVAAKIANKIFAPLQYSETMNSNLFKFWFSNQLLTSLKKGIVMDNAPSIHSAAQTAHCKLIFLPTYSPELNPIEKFGAHLKQYLRNILPFSPSLDDALHTAFKLW